MIFVTCPECSGKDVIRHGKNPCGTARLRCKSCGKTWTPDKKSRALSPETKAAIEGALAERIPQRGIARAFHVSRDTIRDLRKKRPPG